MSEAPDTAIRQEIEAGKQLLAAKECSNSDILIDACLPGLRIFSDFYPYYEDAKAAVGAVRHDGPVVPESGSLGPSGSGNYPHSGEDPQSLRQGLDEFRGIEFAAFRADAEMLRAASKRVDEAAERMHDSWSKNLVDWSGEAETAARQRKTRLASGADTLSRALESAPDAIVMTIDDFVQENVASFASLVLDEYGDGMMAGLTVQDVEGALTALRELPGTIEELDRAIEDLNNRSILERAQDWVLEKLAGVIESAHHSSLLGLAAKLGLRLHDITDENVVEERDKYVRLLESSNTKLAEFVAEYKERANGVHAHAAEHVAAIQRSYGELIKTLNSDLAEDPFAMAPSGERTPGSPGAAGGGAVGSVGGGGSTPAVGGGSGLGGGAVGGGGSLGGGPAGAGSVEPPSVTPSEADARRAMNPITGKPLEVDPETGRPYPIDPKTGEAITDAEPDVDTMTVRSGDTEIAITEPDSTGSMAITIDDGSGAAKRYQLDFSADDVVSTSGPQPVSTGLGPVGSDVVSGGPQGVHTPGDDGAIRIEDGDVTIMAEQPLGSDGATVVTVSDGDGDEQTYVLGDEKAVAEYNQRRAEEEMLLAHDVGAPPEPGATVPAADGGLSVQPASIGDAVTGFAGAEPTPDRDSGLLDSIFGGDAENGAPDDIDDGASVAFRDGTAADSEGIGGSDVLGGEAAQDDDGTWPAPGGAGVGVAPGETPSDATTSSEGGAMGGAPMMGGMGGAGVGATGGGDEQRGGSAFQLDGGGLFEPDVAEGPFGVARISGSLDDDD